MGPAWVEHLHGRESRDAAQPFFACNMSRGRSTRRRSSTIGVAAVGNKPIRPCTAPQRSVSALFDACRQPLGPCVGLHLRRLLAFRTPRPEAHAAVPAAGLSGAAAGAGGRQPAAAAHQRHGAGDRRGAEAGVSGPAAPSAWRHWAARGLGRGARPWHARSTSMPMPAVGRWGRPRRDPHGLEVFGITRVSRRPELVGLGLFGLAGAMVATTPTQVAWQGEVDTPRVLGGHVGPGPCRVLYHPGAPQRGLDVSTRKPHGLKDRVQKRSGELSEEKEQQTSLFPCLALLDGRQSWALLQDERLGVNQHQGKGPRRADRLK